MSVSDGLKMKKACFFVHDALNKRALWINTVAEELMSHGISPGNIELRQYISEPLRTTICVYGIPQFEFEITLVGTEPPYHWERY